MAGNTVNVFTNWESFADMVGSLDGIREGLETDAYINRVIENAHGKTTSIFDVAAASAGKAGGLSHMFEFGTFGVTRGPVRHTDPTSETARLWKHELTGVGGEKNISFSFRPAVTRNPNHTTRHTGVPSKYLRRLSRRKYVFWNKAFVVETGQPVSIKSKQDHGLLFVPFMHYPSMNTGDKRGYMMWHAPSKGPINTVPGRTNQGNFTKFWVTWWSSEGQSLIGMNMLSQVRSDINIATIRAANSAKKRKLKPALANDIVGTVKRGRKRAGSQFRKGTRP